MFKPLIRFVITFFLANLGAYGVDEEASTFLQSHLTDSESKEWRLTMFVLLFVYLYILVISQDILLKPLLFYIYDLVVLNFAANQVSSLENLRI